MQHKAIQHIYLKDDKIQLPKEVKNIDGDYISSYKYREVKYFIRLVEYIPGNLMKDLSNHDKSFINMLGTFLGRISSALQGFEYEDSVRRFPWDISQTDFLYNNICSIDARDKQIIIEQILNKYENKINGDFIESQAFAYLAIRSYLKKFITFPTTTGVKKPCLGGLVYKS